MAFLYNFPSSDGNVDLIIGDLYESSYVSAIDGIVAYAQLAYSRGYIINDPTTSDGCSAFIGAAKLESHRNTYNCDVRYVVEDLVEEYLSNQSWDSTTKERFRGFNTICKNAADMLEGAVQSGSQGNNLYIDYPNMLSSTGTYSFANSKIYLKGYSATLWYLSRNSSRTDTNNSLSIDLYTSGQNRSWYVDNGAEAKIYFRVGFSKEEAFDDAKIDNQIYSYVKSPVYNSKYSKPYSFVLDTTRAIPGKNPLGNVTISDITIKEDVADADNTYPGGGDDKNPYPDGDESGKGTFDNTNDPIDFPAMPLWDATNTGFISMWNPTITEITALYGFLWDSDISTTLKKLFIEPMDAIISLAFFPVDPTIDEKRSVTIGHVDTEISMNHVQKQFVDFDFGSIVLDEYYGAAWDYSPYTKVSIFLPYIGSQELDVDDVMNSTLHLKYRIDLLSGMCVAMLKSTRARDGLDAVVYTWQGNCAMQVPVTAGSAREFLNSIIQLGAMTGLALVQPAAGSIVAAAHKGEEDFNNKTMANNWVNPVMATYSALNVLGQKVHVQRGGRVDANAGVASLQSAFIIINRPVSAIPRGWNTYAGYPSLKIKTLSSQKGYTQVAYIKLDGLEATGEEISELDSILKGGVFL